MHTVNPHRLEHFGESAGRGLRHLLMAMGDWLDASLERLAQRNATRRIVADDEILWDDGEPEENR